MPLPGIPIKLPIVLFIVDVTFLFGSRKALYFYLFNILLHSLQVLLSNAKYVYVKTSVFTCILTFLWEVFTPASLDVSFHTIFKRFSSDFHTI